MVLPAYLATPRLGGPIRAGAAWVVAVAPGDETRALAKDAGLSPLAGRLLWLRGIRTAAAAKAFVDPRLADLEPPDRLPDMAVAVSRIVAAIRDKERIAVCGDYDVDGMTGTALLVRFLTLAGGNVTYAIPDRESDGYGLSVAGVDRLHADGVRLAITVDNGVSAFDALERAKALGIDVVVTDHHLPGATLPPAVAIVDPQRTDLAAGTPPSSLCGCGLAFKLAWGVADALPKAVADARLKSFLKDAVGLVALATVSDVVPLVGENRILVSSGLRALKTSRHEGLTALLGVAGVGATPLTTEDVAWRIAPRLNAAGRLNRPDLAIDLLTATDASTARRLATEIGAANEQRREIERGVAAQALAIAKERVASEAASGARASLVVAGEGWHRGVIGIVAARLVDAHDRPSIVIGLEGDGGRGSCRSTRGIDLHEALVQCKHLLRRYGGHAAAAGLEIERGAVEQFAVAFDAAVKAQAGSAPASSALHLDAEVDPADVTVEAAEEVRRLGPFGAGNPEPRFAVLGARVAGKPRLIGSGSDHLTFALKAGLGAVRVVAFRQSASYDLAASGAPIDLVASLSVNDFRGTRTAELVAHALRPAQA